MNVLIAAAEMAPLVKVGGLADVIGSLPRALRRLGLDARVALPFYNSIERDGLALERVASLPAGGAVWRTDVRGVPVYLVEDEPAFGREHVYGYDDDTARFLTFCDSLLSAAGGLGWQPDLLHLHDSHPAFLALRLSAQPRHPWARLPRILTIHNLAFTGPFDAAFAREHELAAPLMKEPAGVASKAVYSALAQGILHAGFVVTVSPTYAREVLTPEYGWDFAPLLQQCGERLSGIMNGIDTDDYDPATDESLAARFDAQRLERRIENKRAAQQTAGLPVADDVPLLAMVSRLFWQKGSDIAAAAIERLLDGQDFQLIVLGQGDDEHEQPVAKVAARHPDRVAARIEFNHRLGQLLYGGCDLFLMPSRYEPCGLGQLIAMRYGAVPVVRRTGGLADSVTHYDASRDVGTGFLFDQPSPAALAAAVEEALAAFRDPAAWRRLQLRGMAQDWSWSRSATEYVDLYQRADRLATETVASEGADR